MARKVARLGIEREEGFVYYIKRGDVWRVRCGDPGRRKPRPEKLAEGGVEMDAAYIYFLDRDGDIARAKRLPDKAGGQRKGSSR